MKDLNFLRNELFAHRGLHDNYKKNPENSLKAIKLGIKRGYSIEMDIQLTKDEQIVVFHDKTLKRLCGIEGNLHDYTYDELKEFKLLDSRETIPLLEDVIKISGNTSLLIEIKAFYKYDIISRKLADLMKDYEGSWAVFSFDPRVVRWYYKNEPTIIRGHINQRWRRKRELNYPASLLLDSMVLNRAMKPDFISYSIKDIPNKKLDKLFEKGLTIIGYTARSQEELDFFKSHYHNVVFESFIPKK